MHTYVLYVHALIKGTFYAMKQFEITHTQYRFNINLGLESCFRIRILIYSDTTTYSTVPYMMCTTCTVYTYNQTEVQKKTFTNAGLNNH